MALVYNGTLCAKSNYELLSPAFHQSVARFLVNHDLKGHRALDWVQHQITEVHCGLFLSARTQPFDPETMEPAELWDDHLLKRSAALQKLRRTTWGEHMSWTDIRVDINDLFGADVPSTFKNWRRYAERPLEQPVARYLAPRMLVMDWAIQAYEGAVRQAAEIAAE